MNQSFNMESATVMHVPPCEGGETTKEQQAVVERFREQQAVVDRQGVKGKSVQKGPELVYNAEQHRALELVVDGKCPIAQRDGYDTVR